VKNTDGGWELSISVRHGPTGKSVVKLKYPLRGPKVDKETLLRVSEEIPPSLETASAGPIGPETPEAAETPAPTTGSAAVGATGEDVENPLNKKPEAAPSGLLPERPAWAPYFDASIGFLVGGRFFSFSQSGLPQFSGALTAGLRFDATAYPIATLARRPGAVINALTGLGVGVTLDAFFWPDSVPSGTAGCMMLDMSGTTCLDHYSTSEINYEIGFRYHWNVLNRSPKTWAPTLLAQFEFGDHRFTVDKKKILGPDPKNPSMMIVVSQQDVGPPDIDYKYLTIGVGYRVDFLTRFGAFVMFNFHGLLDAGAIQSPGEFGPGAGYGVRLSGGFEVKIWKGLFTRLAFDYQHFGLSFNGQHNGDVIGANGFPVPDKNYMPTVNTMPPCPCGTTGSASDSFWRGALSVGYMY
jgi:hypothetical protein